MEQPVNQSGPSTRTKAVIDRLISLDGGYFTKEMPVKDESWRQKMIKLSQDEPVYDQRMFGKVAAYFITSKDLDNVHEGSVPYPAEFKRLSYVDFTAGMLSTQGTEYGWFHADPFYVVSTANPDVELSLDKDHHDKNLDAQEEAKKVVLAAINKAKEFRKTPPKLTKVDRVNRS